MTRKMIIDTDTASDDAVAIMMALQHLTSRSRRSPSSPGTCPSRRAASTRYTVELCGRDVPVYIGADKPLTREVYRAYFFHGPDGMGGMNYQTTRPVAEGHAVEVLIDTIKANPGIILVTLGPMTNVALALAQAPEIVENVSRCVVMGGAACTVGNITPAAEYNIWCDPEAARMCFRSGLPIEMVGWELCRGEANLSDEDIRYCKEVINTPLSHFAIDCNISALQTNREWLGDPSGPAGPGRRRSIDRDLRGAASITSTSSATARTRAHDGRRPAGVTAHDTANVRCGARCARRASRVTVCWRSTRNTGKTCSTRRCAKCSERQRE